MSSSHGVGLVSSMEIQIYGVGRQEFPMRVQEKKQEEKNQKCGK